MTDDDDDAPLDPLTEVDSPESEPFHVSDTVASARPLTDEEVAALYAEGIPQVRPIAAGMARELGRPGETDDLCSVGYKTLVEIVRDFDPTRASFATFLRRKLRWAMLDSVRRDTHGRVGYARARALAGSDRVADALASDVPDPALPETSHARRLKSVLSAQAAALVLGLTATFSDEASSDGPVLSASADESPETLVLRSSTGRALRDAIERLPERQREIVERHYFGGERFDDIAESLGVSKSWASRLHAQAMASLAQALRDHQ